jgi:hypothetical protein
LRNSLTVIPATDGHHYDIKITTDNIITTVAKDLFRRLIEKYDLVVFVNSDKGFICISNSTSEDDKLLIFAIVIIHY